VTATTGRTPGARRVRVLLVGLGATGMAAGRSLAQRADCELVGAVDRDPGFAGRDLGELLGGAGTGQAVAAGLDGIAPGAADVAFVATTSWLEEVQETVVSLLRRRINVLSICEELAFPWGTHEAIAERLDQISRRHGVSLLGTGCNPGFLLDTLPVVLSSMTQRVSRVEVRRTADMSGYAAILEKFGLGLTVEQFDAAQLDGTVVGHVGFEQAMGALADGLGWTLDELEVDPVRPAFVAPRRRHGDHLTVPAGAVTAVTHSARARRNEELVIDLSINFGIFEPGDPIELGDRILLWGEEQHVEVVATRGFDSFRSTVAMVVNLIGELVAAPPGLLTMADLPIGALGSKGARRSPLSAHAG
jgi:2,4-diaminopentanoate dehydrogenase